jgi:DNA (cytosine-5)-methyltransferase 1
MLRELSLFTGCGGGLYGTKLLGFKTVGYVEFDEYCQKVIAQRIKDGIFDLAPIFGDVQTFAISWASKYRGLVDVVSGGFPCQPFSTAGKRQGAADERNMWPATISIIRKVQHKWVLLENVSGLLQGHGYFGTVLRDLAESGYDAEWCCISAQGMGAPHKRDRLWLVADAQSLRLERFNISTSGGEGEGERIFSQFTGNGCGVGEWWKAEPRVGRVADGVADRSYRLKALGNGQVPTVVREAWKHLTGAQ